MSALPSIRPEEIVMKARASLGTPYHHAGRVPGVGLDCWGLVAVTYAALGADLRDDARYAPAEDLHDRLADHLLGLFDEVDGEPAPGDVLVFRSAAIPNHCGIDTGVGVLIHVLCGSAASRVVETPFSQAWRSRITHRFRYPNLTWQPSS